MFSNLTVPLADIDQVLTNITFVKESGLSIEYKMIGSDGGVPFSQLVLFILDDDGIWRIKFV